LGKRRRRRRKEEEEEEEEHAYTKTSNKVSFRKQNKRLYSCVCNNTRCMQGEDCT